MNGKERILTALNIREADRVPLFIHAINESTIIRVGRFITDGLPPETKALYEMSDQEKGKVIDTLFRILEDFEIDGFTCLPIGPGTEFGFDKEIVDDFGVGFDRSPFGMPVPARHPVKEPDDLKNYKLPKPKREQFLLHDIMKQRFEDTKATFWMMRGAFVRSWRLIGMENLMFKMFDNPQFVHDVAALMTEYSLEQLDMLAEAGLDVLIVEDDIADKNFPLIAPDQFREFINPYNRKLVEAAHGKGLKVVRHSDGNLWPILDILLDTGYDGLNPLEPQADMGLKKVKDYCGDRLCLLGNIDCIDLLPDGTTEEVEAAVKQAIDDAAAGGGLVICSSNSLHPGVNPENVITMFNTTREYGVYGK